MGAYGLGYALRAEEEKKDDIPWFDAPAAAGE
jgi:hypothetical protein